MNIYSSYEINENDKLELEQSNKILVKLKAHQQACLYKAIELEKTGKLYYNINDNEIKIKCNMGILGDMAGYGKTLIALSLIALSKLEDLNINKVRNQSYYNTIYNNSNYNKVIKIKKEVNDIINSTLIIVPKGPVYDQWLYSLQNNTTLKYLKLDDIKDIKKNVPLKELDKIYSIDEYNEYSNKLIDYFNNYEVVLIKNTTYLKLIELTDIKVNRLLTINNRYENFLRKNLLKRWKRVFIDEPHDICNKIPEIYYYRLWLISATPQLIYSTMSRSNSCILYNIKDVFLQENIKEIIVKCNDSYVKKSFNLEIPEEIKYICKTNSIINILKGYINTSILNKINANDYVGAIKELGGKDETENDMINLFTKDLIRIISNSEKERLHIISLDITEESKRIKLKNIDEEINKNKTKLESIKERLSELESKSCPICMDILLNPIVLDCTHTYCMECIINWMKRSVNTTSSCPTCKKTINNKIILINDKCEKKKVKELDKNDTIIKIINKKKTGKFLIFSNYSNSFNELSLKLIKNGFKNTELKGTTAQMRNILDNFNSDSNDLNIILLNTEYAGSGIDISSATDVIIYHDMGTLKNQAVGRAQRVGRKEKLIVHNLYYENENIKY